MDLVSFGVSISLTAIGSVLGLLIGFLGGKLKERRTKMSKEDLAQRNGIQSLLRERLLELCDKYLERKYVHIHELEAMEEIEKSYKDLGGNGAVEKLLNDVKKLEVR